MPSKKRQRKYLRRQKYQRREEQRAESTTKESARLWKQIDFKIQWKVSLCVVILSWWAQKYPPRLDALIFENSLAPWIVFVILTVGLFPVVMRRLRVVREETIDPVSSKPSPPEEWEILRPLGLRGAETEAILARSEILRTKLAECLPFSLKHTSDLKLVYSTNQHGRSLPMLYHRLAETGSYHTILCLEVDSSKAVLGMYVPHPWKNSPKTYGDGRSVLFRFTASFESWKWSSQKHPENPTLLALEETFQRSNHNFLGLGMNETGTGAGLQLNADLTKGESYRAYGFDNDPLVHSNGESVLFDVGLVEVYQLVREIDGLPAR